MATVRGLLQAQYDILLQNCPRCTLLCDTSPYPCIRSLGLVAPAQSANMSAACPVEEQQMVMCIAKCVAVWRQVAAVLLWLSSGCLQQDSERSCSHQADQALSLQNC